ncbi:MAG: hypothetical protein ACYC7E_20490, partial [Armatimonadota bacterium]
SGTGAFDWTGGSLRGTGTTSVAAGFHLNLSGTADKAIMHGSATSGGHKLTNAGVITWSGGRIMGGDGASITNQSGGLFDVQCDASLDYLFGVNPAMTNQAGGTFRKSSTDGVTTFVRFDFTNSGTLNIQQGTVSFTSNTVSHILSIMAPSSRGAARYSLAVVTWRSPGRSLTMAGSSWRPAACMSTAPPSPPGRAPAPSTGPAAACAARAPPAWRQAST